MFFIVFEPFSISHQYEINVNHSVWPIVCAYYVVDITRIIIFLLLLMLWQNVEELSQRQMHETYVLSSFGKSCLGPTSGETVVFFFFHGNFICWVYWNRVTIILEI